MLTTLTQRLEFKEGSSNKFYEVSIHPAGDQTPRGSWIVRTKWGRIGNLGQMQEIPCASQTRAMITADDKVREKIKKGYVDVTPQQKVPKNPPKVKEEAKELPVFETNVKLPAIWNKLKDQLLPGERNVYEKYDDGRTRQRRATLATKFKTLILEPCEEPEIKEMRASAWLFLRFTYLRYLSSVGTYKPATQELARATVSELQKKLQEIPDSQKEALDAGLKKFTRNCGVLSLSECNQGVEAFIETLTREIKEKHKVGVGGVSRIRAKMLKRRRRRNEKKNGSNKQ